MTNSKLSLWWLIIQISLFRFYWSFYKITKKQKEKTHRANRYLLLDDMRGHDFVNNSGVLFTGILLQNIKCQVLLHILPQQESVRASRKEGPHARSKPPSLYADVLPDPFNNNNKNLRLGQVRWVCCRIGKTRQICDLYNQHRNKSGPREENLLLDYFSWKNTRVEPAWNRLQKHVF